MMRCNEIRELLVEYWDLPANDIKRKHLHDHIKDCTSCAEEYDLWRQSVELVQHSSVQFDTVKQPSVSKQVMKRIYADEGWREPIPNRIYSISYRMRRKLTMVIAFFLALFMFGLLYSVIDRAEPEAMYYTLDGLVPVASALGDTSTKDAITGATLQGVPMASISDPFILSVNSIKTYPDYVVALSLLGIICTLLIMNWFSRIKA